MSLTLSLLSSTLFHLVSSIFGNGSMGVRSQGEGKQNLLWSLRRLCGWGGNHVCTIPVSACDGDGVTWKSCSSGSRTGKGTEKHKASWRWGKNFLQETSSVGWDSSTDLFFPVEMIKVGKTAWRSGVCSIKLQDGIFSKAASSLHRCFCCKLFQNYGCLTEFKKAWPVHGKGKIYR